MQTLAFIHVLSGAIAVAVGAVALTARKGATAHIVAGRVFVGAMTLSSVLGAALGLVRADDFLITTFAGVLAAYLVVSGWLAAQDRNVGRRSATGMLSLANFLNAAALFSIGYVALSGDGAFRGFPAEDYFFLGGMAGIAVVGDAAWFLRKRISDRQRIARHLWRMCLGFFIAAGSAFTGPGQSAFPEAVRNSGLLSLPELIIFLALVFYLGKTLFTGANRPG
ncbi:MAG: hypothetical protein AAFX08_05430 [Pseudomonadota bacterium]